MKPTEDRCLTPAEQCSYLGVSKTTLWRLEQDENFPKAIQVSARRKVRRKSDLDAWLSKGGAAA